MTISTQEALQLYRSMVRLRTFDKLTERYTMQSKFVGSIHLAIGQEAVAVGSCARLRPSDVIGITYRGRATAVAKGVDPARIWAEMRGRVTGTSRGKGGPMHIGDPDHGVLTANAIVGAGVPITAGAALAQKSRGSDDVAVSYFGEGAMNQGVLTETVNMAALMKLPLILICESNQYAEMTPAAETSASADLVSRIAPYGIPAVEVDGNDVEAVAAAMDTAVTRARAGEGPTFLDAQTYRLSGHMVGDPNSYRSKEEITARWETEPLARYRRVLTDRGVLDDELAQTIQTEVTADLDAAWAAADAAELTPTADAFTDLFAQESR